MTAVADKPGLDGLRLNGNR
ncbi:uncharacterized protein G2W53_035392 [Senna tora]|uniref:Uncharacterized protein n=1 Tax=Senna tora TaxID=362788 RepID=A0A834T3G3_9FABA|nr:uncharacterized protein G2W53_035392 [Senna tora]